MLRPINSLKSSPESELFTNRRATAVDRQLNGLSSLIDFEKIFLTEVLFPNRSSTISRFVFVGDAEGIIWKIFTILDMIL